MREAGLVVGETLQALRQAAVPGVTPLELDELARDRLAERGATSSFLGYYGFPAVICASVNSQVVHGIPDSRPLESGDVISIDFGASVSGWHSDSAITVPVGDVDPEVLRLSEVCEQALWDGIAAMTAGGWLRDIGTAVQRSVRFAGSYGIVEGYTGHGIGTEMHQDPPVPNVRTRSKGPRLVPGVVLAVEPMVTLGSPKTTVMPDGWTVQTDDGRPAVHWEHSIAVTSEGPWVLSAVDGGAARLSAMGVRCAAAALESDPHPQ